MSIAVFINCRRCPFIDMMLSDVDTKTDETRTRNMLRAVVGRSVFLTETGRGPSMVRASAVIGEPIVARSREEWEALRSRHRVPAGSQYDWQPETKIKYLYPILNIRPVPPFHPPEGIRHGRAWMEFND